MKLIGLTAALALVGATAAVPASSDKDVRLVGCVVKADGGYVLTNVTVVPAGTATVGTSGTTDPTMPVPPAAAAVVAPRTFYWLQDDDDLDGHAGHRVEVVGDVEEIERGKISVEREGDMIELEFKVEGEKKVTVKVPDTPAARADAAVGTTGAVTDREKDFDVKVKKVDVKSVKMLASSCS